VSTSQLDLVEAARRFFREDSARILSVASSLRAPGRTVESTVLGGSMGRTIPAGTRIRIELSEPRSYDPGDVVAFVSDQHLIVHRVIRAAGRPPRGYVFTRGDASLISDPPVPDARVLGAVTAMQREGQWTSVGAQPVRAWPARAYAWLVLRLVSWASWWSPAAADTVVRTFYRSRSLLVRLRLLRRPSHP
jgi:signal peptidase I